jgi:hypothetical protein
VSEMIRQIAILFLLVVAMSIGFSSSPVAQSDRAFTTAKFLCADISSIKAKKRCITDNMIIQRLNQVGNPWSVGGVNILSDSCLSQSDRSYMAPNISNGLANIPIKIGRPINKAFYGSTPITIFVVDGPLISHTYSSHRHHPELKPKPFIFLPCSIIKERRAPIIHELTHLFMVGGWSASLREGLADYLQFSIMPDHPSAFTEPFANHHSLVSKSQFALDKRVLASVGTWGFPSLNGKFRREHFYHSSRSFVYFLIEKYTMELFLAIHDSADKSAAYYRLTGKSLPTIKGEWQKVVADAGANLKP